jgi:hypothetical protein
VNGSALNTGSNSIIAYFEGDGANDAPSTSSAQTVTVTVGSTSPATLTAPTPGIGTKLGTTNVTFTWTSGTGVTEYELNLSAVAAGDTDVFVYKGTATSAVAASLPGNDVEVYARLYSKINGVWQYNDYVYTESGTPALAVLTSPTPGIGTKLGTTGVTFHWTSGGDVAEYQLDLSAISAGGSELFLYKGTATTATAARAARKRG